MESKSEIAGHAVRVVALACLGLGFYDAARALGLWDGTASPIAALGLVGFVYTAVAALVLLFAAVGLWIRASWGAVLLVGALGTQIVLYALGNRDVSLTLVDVSVRGLVLLAMMLIFAAGIRLRRLSSPD